MGLSPGCDDGAKTMAATDATNGPQLPSLELSADERLGITSSWNSEQSPSLMNGFVDISPSTLPPTFVVEPGDPDDSVMGDLSGGLIADLDGDGRSEVIYGIQFCCEPDEKAQVFALTEDGKGLEHVPGLSTAIQEIQGMVSAVIDLDGDGIPELLGANPQKFLSWGREDGTFAPPEDMPGSESFMGNQTHQGSISFHDIDRDGWLDILVTDHSCDESSVIFRPLLRSGLRTFSLRTDLVDHSSQTGAAYATMAYDAPTGDTVLLSIGQPCSSTDPNDGFMTSTRDQESGFPMFTAQDLTPENSLYKTNPVVSYGPMTVQRPMGATRADFDGDGFEDLMVSLFDYYALFQGTQNWPFEDQTATSGLSPPSTTTGRNMIPWGVLSVDLDKDGREDVMIAHGDDDTSFTSDSARRGPQEVRAAWNAGDFAFEGFQDQTVLSKAGNWRSLTMGDLEGDGDPDFIIGGLGLPPRVLMNTIENENRGLAIRLEGTTSNHLGIGATIRMQREDGSLGPVHTIGKNASPMFASDMVAFLGIGPRENASVEVHWPTGFKQVVSGLEAGTVHVIVEPPLITLSEPSRRVEWKNQTPVTVTVTPRNDDGTMDMEAKVAIKIAHGHNGFSLPPVETESGFERTLSPPSEPGYSVIEVFINDEPSGVRPRIWWTD